MYQELRSQGKLSYAKVEQMFEEHQSKWSEAIFNEDSWFKYIDPLIQDGSGAYLSMMQGSKEEQRKWWLYNRFRYIDSKYNAGDALSDLIQIRGYAKSNVTVTPYADIYPSVKYGSYLVQARGHRGVSTTLVCPLDQVNDTEIYIYSASQLASAGDLSGFKVGFADFSMATRIQSIKLGDSDNSYTNANLTSLTLGNNVLLKTLDVRNCTALGTGEQKSVDISGCEIIENVYFDGTAIQGVTLPNGGVLKKLHLPSTMTNLTIMNQGAITEFVIPSYANITTLRLENVSSVVNGKTILNAIAANSRVRLIGFYWEAEDADEIDDILDVLDTMRGLDEQGGNVDTAQVSGTIHTTSLTGEQIAAFQARYPYITFAADHIATTLRYYNYNATTGAYDTLMDTITCLDGVPERAYSGSTPTRAATAANTFTFNGWSKSQNATTPDADAQTNVTENRDIYASYAVTGRTYTVTFVRSSTDGGGTLQTINNVAYGTVVTAASAYTGATPTTTKGSATDYPFEGWNPASATVQGMTTFTAKFGSPVEVAEITDSWDTIIANIDNGTYSTAYKVGNYKPLDLGTEGTINMQIVAMNADELASGGYAPLTFIGMELLNTRYAINISQKTIDGKTGYASGGWLHSNIRQILQNTILPLINTANNNVAKRLQVVVKTQDSNTDGQYGQTTEDKLWLPSNYEVGVASVQPSTNIVSYTSVFKNNTSRIKNLNGTASSWWLRSGNPLSNSHFNIIAADGSGSTQQANGNRGVCLGFCLGLEQETITDDWATILANQNYATDYSIGDTKMLDMGTEGKQLMEIVAFNTDDRADGQGKAGITWISKGLLNTTYKYNNSATTIGGWSQSEIRSYLKNTIKPLIPATVRNAIIEVNKVSSTYENNALVNNGQATVDDVWIPSYRELALSYQNSQETTGANYGLSETQRVKKSNGSASQYWLRSVRTNAKVCVILGTGENVLYGEVPTAKANYVNAIALGFCTN